MKVMFQTTNQFGQTHCFSIMTRRRTAHFSRASQVASASSLAAREVVPGYPLVNFDMTIEHHHF